MVSFLNTYDVPNSPCALTRICPTLLWSGHTMVPILHMKKWGLGRWSTCLGPWLPNGLSSGPGWSDWSQGKVENLLSWEMRIESFPPSGFWIWLIIKINNKNNNNNSNDSSFPPSEIQQIWAELENLYFLRDPEVVLLLIQDGEARIPPVPFCPQHLN